MTPSDFLSTLESILESKFNGDYRSAVGIVQDGKRWLLGLCTHGDRKGLWCHPGGRLRDGESAEEGAEREVEEETGIKCKAIGKPFTLPNHEEVAFVHCKLQGKPHFDNNHEFRALGLFNYEELKSLKLYHNVLQLIDRVRH